MTSEVKHQKASECVGSMTAQLPAPLAGSETVFVTDPNNEIFRYLVLDAARRMKQAGCNYLRIELRNGKVLFEALPDNEQAHAMVTKNERNK